MTTFIQQLVQEILKHHKDHLEDLCVVFPTRRAGLFFQKELSQSLNKPAWSPTIFSIQDFFMKMSGMNIPDSLTLLFELYESYREFFPAEDFSRFYAWGELMLKDFGDIDKYMADANKVFANVNDLHEIDAAFELEGEDLERLREFWKNFFNRDPSKLRNEFMNTWKFLGNVYHSFQSRLRSRNIAYEGMAYRSLAEKMKQGDQSVQTEYSHIIFAGFYALAPTEQTIIHQLVKAGKATTYWDADSYYADDKYQESGKFFRNNKLIDDKFLWKQDHFKDIPKKIEFAGVPLLAGQAKYAGNILEDLMKEKDFVSEKTAVILPDEKLLFPLLYSLPKALKDINVTMGYPLRQTPLYNLFESLMVLQKNARTSTEGETSFYFRDILNIVNHSYIRQIADKPIRKWLSGLDQNFIRLPRTRLIADGDGGLFSDLFVRIISVDGIFDWFRMILSRILESMKDQDFRFHKLESEFVYHFYTQLGRLEDIVKKDNHIKDIETFWKIFSEIIFSVKIPFTGEPLKGLQVMGFLETRVLDFDNVIILSVNEDVLPSSGNSPSFIPFNIRKAFGLPTYEEQHSVSSFHFYRLLQRAKNIYLIHNTETKALTTGERSRFLLQIEHELMRKFPDSISLEQKVISTKIGREYIKEISIEKSPDVMKDLSKFLPSEAGRQSAFSASGLISYIACPLRFYFKYVAGLAEPEEQEEDMEAATFGKVLHKAMQYLYTDVHEIDVSALGNLRKKVNDCVDQAIHNEFVAINQLEGKNILLRNVIRELINRILDSEKLYIPFQILQLEKDVTAGFKLDEDREVKLFGIIDRVDEKSDVVRIVDYKTGRVEKKRPAMLEEYFTNPKMKEQFQAMYYAYLTRIKMPGRKIKSGLLAMRDMSEGIWFLNDNVPYSDEQFTEFETHLRGLLSEIFSTDKPFTQTEDLDRCQYCAYKSLCNRNTE